MTSYFDGDREDLPFFDPNYSPKFEKTPKKQVEKEPVATLDNQIDNIISNGGSADFPGVDKKAYMRLVSKYSKERNNGDLRLSLRAGVLTAKGKTVSKPAVEENGEDRDTEI